jgi:hypothetical protein
MQVAVYTSSDGRKFYSDIIGQDPTPEGAQVEVIEMSEDEYKAIPATAQAREFFRSGQ